MPASDGRPGRGAPPHALGLTAALGAAHAVLLGAAYPGLDLWPATFLAATPLAWLALGAASARRAVLVVLVAHTALWLWMHRWVAGVTAAGWAPLALYLALYGVLFVFLLRRIAADRRLGAWPATLLVPVIWVGLEFLRGRLAFNGYPWFLAGHPLIHWPMLVQSADLLGTYFASFLAVTVAGLATDALRLRRGALSRRAFAAAAAATALLLGADLLYGAWRLAGAPPPGGPLCLAIQTDVPQSNKLAWTPQQQVEDVARLLALTETGFEATAAAARRPDLVIWPETMLPGFGLDPATVRAVVEAGAFPGDAFSAAVEALAARLGTPLLVGSPAYTGLRAADGRWTWDEHYNAAYLVTGAPPHQRYDKVFLTPFGETMPYISQWPWLERRLLALGAAGMSFDLDAADRVTRLHLPVAEDTAGAGGALTVATPICFEDTVPRLCRRMVYGGGRGKATDLLVNLSNDGWFGDSVAGRRRHGQIARFRCIENRVPMIRCVNTGVTMAVDSSGRLIEPAAADGGGARLAARRAGWLAAELPPDPRSTLYGRVGDLWGWACLLGTAGLWLAAMAMSRCLSR